MNEIREREFTLDSQQIHSFTQFKAFCRQESGKIDEKCHHLGYIHETKGFRKYSICKSSPSSLTKHGLGLHLYFLLIKHLCFLFFIISLISIGPIKNNFKGNGNAKINQFSLYMHFSVANQPQISESERSLDKAEKFLSEIQNNLEVLWKYDIVCSIIFLVFICYFAAISRKIVYQNIEEDVNIEDFSVVIKGFDSEVTCEMVREHLMGYEISEISLARNFLGQLLKYKKRYRLYDDIKKNQRKKAKKQKLLKLVKKIDEFDNCAAIDKEIEKLLVNRVFVVLDDRKSKMKLIQEHYSQSKVCCRKKYSQTGQKNSAVKLSIKNAPDPSNILWQNLEYSSRSKIKIRYFILFLTTLVIILSLVMNNIVESYFISLPTDFICESSSVDGSDSLSEAKIKYTKYSDISCYCKQKMLTELLNNSDLNSYCENYLKDIGKNMTIRISISVGTVIINLVLREVINRLSKYERFTNNSKLRLHTLLRLFIMMFINTAITILIANAKVPGNKPMFLNGKYFDFTRQWYNHIGSTIIVTMMVNILSPHFFTLVIVYPFNACKKRLANKLYKSDYKLRKINRGENFEISSSLAQVLTVVFTCYMYSGGIPLLNVICFLALVATYWCNKILILRYYCKPPVYSADINRRVLKILPFAVAIHCAVSLYMYGAPDIFPESYEVNKKTGFLQVAEISLFQRCQKNAGIANFICFALSIFLFFSFFFVLRKYQAMKLRRAFKDDADSNLLVGNAENILTGKKDIGNNSYNIMENPKYSKLVKALNLSVINKKKNLVIASGQINQSEEAPLEFDEEKLRIFGRNTLGFKQIVPMNSINSDIDDNK